MSILYVTEPGATLVKRGSRLVVEKKGQPVQWVHAHRVEQVVLMGPVSLSPGAVAFLLQQGIDTVFLSYYGRYRGRLIAEFGKNIHLRRQQFQKLEDPATRLRLARRYVAGKLANCRTLLRRQNQELQDPEVTAVLHQLRRLLAKAAEADSLDSLMGVEGAAAAAYFGVLGRLLRVPDITFTGRNRRPPRDPMNVLLSLGYTLLANAVQTQVQLTGLDPYLGCLHGVEYGRPSLVLDLMEEFRPVLVDALVLSLINRRIIRPADFFRPEEREPAAFDFAEEEPPKEGYPILLAHTGMKKFITHFEERLHQKVLYLPLGQRLSYRRLLLEQVRLLVRDLSGEDDYQPFLVR